MQARPSLFKVPSGQFITIHAFTTGENGQKQFPMVYVLMKKRTTEDYVKLFEGRAVGANGVDVNVKVDCLHFEAAQLSSLEQWNGSLSE